MQMNIFVIGDSALTSFLTLLSQWDKQEIEERLHQRVEFSKRAIGKLLSAYDRLLQRNQKMRTVIKDRLADGADADIKEGTNDGHWAICCLTHWSLGVLAVPSNFLI